VSELKRVKERETLRERERERCPLSRLSQHCGREREREIFYLGRVSPRAGLIHSPRNLISSEKKNDDESSGIVIKTLSESVLSLHGGLEPEFPKEFHFWVFFLFFSWTQIPSALAGIHTPLSRAIFNPGFQSMCLNRVIASHDMSPFGIPRYQQRQLG
jgi:hypothetical protein